MVKARIVKDASGTHRILCQRGKFKHWFLLGRHHPTDREFSKALGKGLVIWEYTIMITDNLFEQ